MTLTLVKQAQILSSSFPITDIYIGKRRRRDYGNMEELKKDMRENGQITAITVCPPTEEDLSADDYKGQHWSLVAGGRRLRAAAELGWESIRAIDRESMDELTRRVLELAENLQRQNMSFVEVALAKQEMFLLRKEQNPEITQAEVAKEVGETPKTFSQDLAVASALERRPELKQASSRKAVLRQSKLADHFEARSIRDEVTGGTYMLDLASRLVTGDMRDYLRTFADESVDLMVPDLPYGIDHYNQGHKLRENSGPSISEYDDSEATSLDLFVDAVPQMIRVTRKTGWVVCFMSEANYNYLKILFQDCCGNHYEYQNYHEGKPTGWCSKGTADSPCEFHEVEEPRWYWYRPNSQNNPRNPENNAKNMIECILVYNRGSAHLMRPCENVLMYDAEYGSRIDAMQKPLEMYKDLISRFTLPGETVVDPCYGSGAALAAGASLARDIRGCELKPIKREAALGFVSAYYTGVAPRGRNVPTEEFIEARFAAQDQEDEDIPDDALDEDDLVEAE